MLLDRYTLGTKTYCCKFQSRIQIQSLSVIAVSQLELPAPPRYFLDYIVSARKNRWIVNGNILSVCKYTGICRYQYNQWWGWPFLEIKLIWIISSNINKKSGWPSGSAILDSKRLRRRACQQLSSFDEPIAFENSSLCYTFAKALGFICFTLSPTILMEPHGIFFKKHFSVHFLCLSFICK